MRKINESRSSWTDLSLDKELWEQRRESQPDGARAISLWPRGEAGMIAQRLHSSHGALMAVLWSAEREQAGK